MNRPDYWIQTYSGKRFSLENPHASLVDIEDIGHALANLCRFTGHSQEFWSVAEHSLLMQKMFPNEPRMELLALLHDAHEAYVGDISTPVKMYLESFFPDVIHNLTERINHAIFDTLEVTPPNSDEVELIRSADIELLNYERQMLMLNVQHEWQVPLTPVHPTLHRQFIRRERDVVKSLWITRTNGLLATTKRLFPWMVQ